MTDDSLLPATGANFHSLDPFATARKMARSAGFGDNIARFILAQARGELAAREGRA